MTARWGGCAQHAPPFLSLSNPLSLCFAVSPFDTLVAAIGVPSIKGTDNKRWPLTHQALDSMRDNFAFMSQFIQFHFTFLDGARLSEDDAKGLAVKATSRLLKGTLLLQPYTLGRACTMMSVSPPYRRMVCPDPHLHFACCGYPCGTALSPRLCRYGGAHVTAALHVGSGSP